MSIVVVSEDDESARALALQLDSERRAAGEVIETVAVWTRHECLDARDRRRAYSAWQYMHVVTQPRAISRSAEALSEARVHSSESPTKSGGHIGTCDPSTLRLVDDLGVATPRPFDSDAATSGNSQFESADGERDKIALSAIGVTAELAAPMQLVA